MLQDYWANAIYSVVPTILVGLLFWLVMRAILRADRTERKVYAEIEAEERAKLGMPPAPPSGSETVMPSVKSE
ncbi:MAG: hypothetical protein ABI238_05535 [Terrimesophilobacter sp.]